MIMVVQRLPVDRRDDREREFVIVGISNFGNGGGHFAFADARTNGAHGGQMHVGCHDTSLFYFGNFFFALIVTLVDNAHNKRYGRFFGSRNDA